MANAVEQSTVHCELEALDFEWPQIQLGREILLDAIRARSHR